MKIDCRKTMGYLAVNVDVGGSQIDLGFHDLKEAKQLLSDLQEAVSDIEWFIQTEEP